MEVDELQAGPDSYEPSRPKPIIKLSRDVINKIAAAEVTSIP
jgi:hypothetical protein